MGIVLIEAHETEQTGRVKIIHSAVDDDCNQIIKMTSMR